MGSLESCAKSDVSLSLCAYKTLARLSDIWGKNVLDDALWSLTTGFAVTRMLRPERDLLIGNLVLADQNHMPPPFSLMVEKIPLGPNPCTTENATSNLGGSVHGRIT